MPGPWDSNTLFHNAATITANTNGSSFRVGEGAECRVELTVTGTVSGTSPTLDAKIEDSADNSSFATTGVTFTQITATGARQERQFKARKGRPYIRLALTTGGTSPSFGGTTGRLGHWSGRATDAATTDP
jgi:hypothetical protein